MTKNCSLSLSLFVFETNFGTTCCNRYSGESFNIVKKNLCNKMENQWMNDCFVIFIEKDVFCSILNDLIICRFQDSKDHQNRLYYIIFIELN